jgi:hypothetical protein
MLLVKQPISLVHGKESSCGTMDHPQRIETWDEKPTGKLSGKISG